MMKNYVISLSTATDRREHITQEFGKQGIDFEFFDAITPKDLVEQAEHLKLTQVLANTLLSDNEKACFFSHIAVMQKAINQTSQQQKIPYSAFFEDDIYLGENSQLFLQNDELFTHLSPQISLLKLETFLQHKKIDTKNRILLADQRYAVPMQEYHLGMAGYMMSHDCIEQFLTYVRQLPCEKIVPIDRLLFDDFMFNHVPAYQLVPALCIQDHIKNPENIRLISHLDDNRKAKLQHKPKRTAMQKIKGELSNVYRKTLGKLQRQYIDFK
ncbi:MAG: glycosyltransferase family 25 protein [Acinetobacter sp.]|nr:glycosyltransferase family 25 protein [Acinetobacter sp.]